MAIHSGRPLTAYLSTALTDNYQVLAAHPSVRMVDELIESAETGIDIANESYQPQFGIEVMYGYRQANGMNGQPASDLVSAFLTLDLPPLFTDKRQDKKTVFGPIPARCRQVTA